jgi:virginiamycin B lyase
VTLQQEAAVAQGATLKVVPGPTGQGPDPDITELTLEWPGKKADGATHELAYDPGGGHALWITGYTYNAIAKVTLDLKATFVPMPAPSSEIRPHGIAFDGKGRLWFTLEGSDSIMQMGRDGKFKAIDVHANAPGGNPVNPHGLSAGHDGETMWFTGKTSCSVGRINPDGSVEHFPLVSDCGPDTKSAPIFLSRGPDGTMWCTELTGNTIDRIAPDGKITRIAIPTENSRPIGVIPGPDGRTMWFSEEHSHKIGRVGPDGAITEFLVPPTQPNMLLASLAFDREGNLWTQSYVDLANSSPEGPDYLVKIDKSILDAGASGATTVTVTRHEVPTRKTGMHRIIPGPGGNLWFTERATDKLGRMTIRK